MTTSVPLTVLVLVGVVAPALLFAILGAASLLNRPIPERSTSVLAAASMTTSFGAFVIAFAVYGATGARQLVSYGAWSTAHEGGVAIEFLVDHLSLAFSALTTAIAGICEGESEKSRSHQPTANANAEVRNPLAISGSAQATA